MVKAGIRQYKSRRPSQQSSRFACALWRSAVPVLVLLSTGLVPQGVLAAASVTVDLSRIGDASHFEFSGNNEWKYDLKRESGKSDRVTLRLQGLKPDAIARLRKYKDTLVKGVEINENGVDGAAEVTFSVSPKSDFFDYITEQPSRLIVDFFPSDSEETENEAPVPQKSAPKKPAAKPKSLAASDEGEETEGATKDISALITGQLPAKKAAKKTDSRKPAGTDYITVGENEALPSLAEQISSQKDFSHGIFDGGDPEYKRFTIRDYEIRQDSILASRSNFYLPFPMLDLGNPQLNSLRAASPSYEIVPNDTKENKEARVLLNLYTAKKRALFLKGADEFLAKYPESAYDEIIRYMKADTHYTLWRTRNSSPDFEKAMGLYQLLTEKYPKSPVTPRTLLLIGYSYHDRGDSFGALKAFQRFTRTNPESKHLDHVNVSIAESYLRLNRFDDAYKMFDELEKSSRTKKGKFEAAFRKGDVYFRKRDWNEAIRQHKQAIAKYPEEAKRYPNAWYNLAEAHFQNGQFKEALEAYRVFLMNFPDHEHGGYAMTRMGELLGILGADPKRAQGAFFESYFRYRASPGAGVARIRSLASRIPEMKDKELGSALREIASISNKYSSHPVEEKKPEAHDEHGKPAGEEAAKAEEKKEGEHGGDGHASESHAVSSEEEDKTKRRPELPGIEEFSTLLIADGFQARKEYDKAATDLIAYYQLNPQSENKERLISRIKNNISLGIHAAVDRGDFIEGLRRYSKNTSGWLKNSERVDVRYDVGRAYEQAGVMKEASSIYKEVLKRLEEIKKEPGYAERRIFESLPTSDAVRLRLATVAADQKDLAGAESYLKSLPDKALLTDSEQIERAGVAADVAEGRGQPDVARKYLTQLLQTWKGDPQLTGPLHLRLAKISMAAKDYKAADLHIAKIIEIKNGEGEGASLLPDDIHAKALEMLGSLQLTRGKRKEAIAAYRELLEKYEEKRPLASIRYRLGQLLFEDGEMKEAEATWAQLSPETDKMWSRLANEQMQGAKWQSEYKKYLSRIPAAADLQPKTGNR